MRRPDPAAGCVTLTLVLLVCLGVTIAIVKSVVWLRLAFGDLL